MGPTGPTVCVGVCIQGIRERRGLVLGSDWLGPLRTEAFGAGGLACGRGQRTGSGRTVDVATVGLFLSCSYLLSLLILGGLGFCSTKGPALKGA